MSGDGKKICIIGITLRVDDTRTYHRMAHSLSEHGFEVELIGLPPVSEPELDFHIVKGNMFSKVLSACKIALDIDADVYQCHGIQSLPVGFLLKENDKKVVFGIDELYTRTFQKVNLKGKIYKLLMSLAEPVFVKKMNGVIAGDEVLAERYQNWNPNVVLVSFATVPEGFGNIYKREKRSEEKVLVYAGALESETRGVWQMLEMIKKLEEDIKLMLIGPISAELYSKIVRYVRNNNLNDRVILKGEIPHEKVPRYLKSSEIGMNLLDDSVPRYNSQVTTKVFEYSKCGLPQLGSDVGPNLRYIEGERWGKCVPYGNVEAAVKAVRDLLDNWEEYHVNCLKNIKKYYWEDEEKKLVEFYDRLLA